MRRSMVAVVIVLFVIGGCNNQLDEQNPGPDNDNNLGEYSDQNNEINADTENQPESNAMKDSLPNEHPELNSPDWIQHDMSEEEYNELQKVADNGHRVSLLDPLQVGLHFLEDDINLSVNDHVAGTDAMEFDNATYIVMTLHDERTIELEMIQPVRQEVSGIWVVQRYRIMEESP